MGLHTRNVDCGHSADCRIHFNVDPILTQLFQLLAKLFDSWGEVIEIEFPRLQDLAEP